MLKQDVQEARHTTQLVLQCRRLSVCTMYVHGDSISFLHTCPWGCTSVELEHTGDLDQ